MNIDRLRQQITYLVLGLAFGVHAFAAVTDISTTPLNTYSASSSTDVKANVLFVLDDSGSMDWDFMPDWACASYSTRNSACNSTGQDPLSARAEHLFRNPAYNGVYYNPALLYKPPVAVTSTGALSTTTYPSMTGASSATGGDATASAASRNWKAVKDDAYGVQSALTTVSNLQTDLAKPAYFYTMVPAEYCREPSLKTCQAATAPSATYPYPVLLKWCNSSALSTCKASFDSTYAWVRAAAPVLATLTISGTTSTSVSSIRVGGQEILSGATAASTSATILAQNIVDNINMCSGAIVSPCTVAGYNASRSGSVITIAAPAASTATPAVTMSGSMTVTPTAFSGNTVPGKNLRTVITPQLNSYPYPGTSAKAAARTDCAGTTCTYIEEMTNYANWWTYYKSRMQMMKTAASNTFAAIDSAEDIASSSSRFRLGFMSINNNTSSDFLNLNEFKSTQKYNWYTKLISANPGSSTPLRAALAKAGRLYAGKLTSLNGVTVSDPLQYACQRNYTILSTDGFWNETSGFTKMDGSTSVGNQDAALDRPLKDGGSAQIQTRTAALQSQSVTAQPQSSTSNLQSRTVISTAAPSIQKRTSSNSGSTWTAWADVASCTLDTSGSTRTDCLVPKSTSSDSGATFTDWSYAASCSSDTSGPTRTACSGSVNVASAWSDVASCTTSGTTQCQYTAFTTPLNTASCTPLARSSASPYTVGVATQCTSVTSTGVWTNAASCTASATQNCQYTAYTSWSDVSSCTALAPSAGPAYTVATARQCQTLTSGGSSNTLADVAAYYYETDLRSSAAADGTGTCSGPVIAPATTPSDLCDDIVRTSGLDVARHQHMTTFTLGLGAQGQMVYTPDYASSTSTLNDFYAIKAGATANPTSGICSWQASGTVCNWPGPTSNSETTIDDLWHAAINGRGSYVSAADPSSLAVGLAESLTKIGNDAAPGTAAAAASSNPNVSSSDNYVFSSSYKSVEWYGELIRQNISNTTGELSSQNWSAMKLLDCATTSWVAAKPYVAGNVYGNGTTCYSVRNAYTSGLVFGSADTDNADIVHVDETATPLVAATRLGARRLYTRGASGLIPFTWSELGTAGLQAYFTAPALTYTSATAGLSNFCASGASCLTSDQQSNTTLATGGAAGEALVNFLRGDRSYEKTYFRERVHVLGDIVSSEARYVQTPLFNYSDANYLAFKELVKTRASMVYVGSNDGMLHAFNATDGQEAWAYIPTMVLPNLYKLADPNYAGQHQFFVDASPEVGDICPRAPAATCTASEWRTILVGGLNRGGKGYYALDITNPAAPALLWEFTDANLGWSYGNPKITKLKNGTWVVMFASGHNNADGVGRLFVLNAGSGAKLATNSISTGVGSATTPSGLARISAHVLLPSTDNTTIAAYGGDVLGNLWRFDVNGDIGASGYEAHRLVSFRDASDSTKAQPVTVKPLEATILGQPVIFVGTGRYLGVSDVSDTSRQSFYAVRDTLGTTTYSDPHVSGSGFVRQTLTSGVCPGSSSFCVAGETVLTSSDNPVDWTDATVNGWYIDFVNNGERSSTDPALGLGTLLFTTIMPSTASADPCRSGKGSSFVYALNYLTGGEVAGANDVVGRSLGEGLVTRPVLIEQSDGTVRALIRTSGGALNGSDLGSTLVLTPPVVPPSASGTRRVSWRELPTTK